MLGNCDNITTTPIHSNHWPQKQILLDDPNTLMASSSSSPPHKASPMLPADKHPLNCPRCDSSNTKFCYYNNYSLSQPRHFCKACKRYWTRGGTLRNVPVGGGCRKNKRPRRRDGVSSSAAASAHPQIDLSPPSSHIQSPLFYGLPTNNPLELNFPFSSFRVSSSSSDNAGFDLHPQINGLGLGFSSNNGFHDGMSNSSTASPFSTAAANHSSLFFESSSSSSTMASLLASTLQHQKFAPKDTHAPGLMAYEDPQMPGMGKPVKGEGENSRLAWNPSPNPHPNPNPIDQINSSDPSSLLWNTTSIGAWFDPSSIGSSVPSLI